MEEESIEIAEATGASVSTERLREKIRNYSREHREHLRAAASDCLRFGLGEINFKVQELDQLNEADVKGLAVRIKRRKHATEEDMYRLCHAFLQGEENIVTFSQSAAIPVIVKELTGHDASRQIAAAECFCNLALGEAAICNKIVSAAGSYLVTYLDSMEQRLKRTCLWTLANILATGGKGAVSLMHMELVPKLWTLYVADNGESMEDYREDAAICLQLISIKSSELLRDNDRAYISANENKKNPTCPAAEYHLQIVSNCELIHPDAPPIEDEAMLLYFINYALCNLCHTDEYASTEQRLRVLYAVRVLSNLLATSPAQQAYGFLQRQLANTWQTNLVEVLNKIFAYNDEALRDEGLWLLRNITNLEQAPSSQSFVDNLLSHLRIPVC